LLHPHHFHFLLCAAIIVNVSLFPHLMYPFQAREEDPAIPCQQDIHQSIPYCRDAWREEAAHAVSVQGAA